MSSAIKIAEEFYNDEYSDSVLYAELAKYEKNKEIKEEFLRLSRMEAKHAKFWHDFLVRRGVKPKKPRIKKLTFFTVKLLRKLFGPAMVVSMLEMGENSAIQKYFKFFGEFSDEITEEEFEGLRGIIIDELEHEKFFSESKKLFHVENIRDFVLGMNDGLVEILGAVTGLSAVYPNSPRLVGISGLIVGVAGALSMGIGALISVRSQRQVSEAIRERTKILFKVSPEKAKEELYEKLVEGGLPEEIAREVSEKLLEKEEAIIKLLVPEEEENEFRAALYTGIAYLFGVAFPVTPYFFASTSLRALPISVTLAGLALAIVATSISLISGISIRKKVIEMVTTGLGAAFLSYIFGHIMESLFNVSAL
ncbi:VIT1/CCC1 transporter family protein [Pyrococcus horikoshii]|uniref:Rubrerythrin diiron-binding domain-containing protein n=2 Tax=Pyrococcus horikoshii TaxID=53953 RepID=O58063_PYRHO|nr:VIT1/CCC1 transporter family protein [Pyrococcus horikoshii]BAA29399.1 364aa long hypothetical protein [Pyrococcus horikoshii OT3]HII61095.1 rubrerythrin family protein [Pyrococcus horikoshii]